MDTVLMHNQIVRVIKRETPYGDRTVINMQPAVMVVALDDDQNVHLLEEYMAPTEEFEPTFAKGAIELGETPPVAARRELEEELGLVADHIGLLLQVQNQPSHSTARTYIFLATGCRKTRNAAKGDEAAGSVRHVMKPLNELIGTRAEYFSCVRCRAAMAELIIRQSNL